MYVRFLLIPVVLLLSSCATLFNKKDTAFLVRTSEPAQVFMDDSLITSTDSHAALDVYLRGSGFVKNKARADLWQQIEADTARIMWVERNSETLKIKAIHDTIEIECYAKPKNDPAYIAGNIYNLGIGCLIDRRSPKRYKYADVYINFGPPRDLKSERMKKRHVNLLRRDAYMEKGRCFFTVGLPWTNFFWSAPNVIHPYHTRNEGFWGISLAADYHYAKRHFLSLEASAIANLFIPVPAAVDLGGWWEHTENINIALFDNYHARWFSIGYGLNLARKSWRSIDHGNNSESSVKWSRYGPDELYDRRWTAGIVTSIYYKIAPRTKVGFVYRPSFYSFGFGTPGCWVYEYSMSIDIKFNILLGKKIRLN